VQRDDLRPGTRGGVVEVRQQIQVVGVVQGVSGAALLGFRALQPQVSVGGLAGLDRDQFGAAGTGRDCRGDSADDGVVG